MVSMPSIYNEHTYELSSIEQKYVYTDAYSGYAFNQEPLPKPCLHANPIDFEPFSDNLYSSWAGVPTEGYYLADHQVLHEQYSSGYPYDTTATLYMTGYHAMEYEFNTGLPNHSGLLPGFATGAYSPPHDGSSSIPSYPQTAWSPSEPSVASLSPPYESQWEERDVAATVEFSMGDVADEVLQGLGLYDCPELATDCGSTGELYTCCPSLGRGLKLEESFEFRKEYSDEEEDDDEDDEDDDEDEDED